MSGGRERAVIELDEKGNGRAAWGPGGVNFVCLRIVNSIPKGLALPASRRLRPPSSLAACRWRTHTHAHTLSLSLSLSERRGEALSFLSFSSPGSLDLFLYWVLAAFRWIVKWGARSESGAVILCALGEVDPYIKLLLFMENRCEWSLFCGSTFPRNFSDRRICDIKTCGSFHVYKLIKPNTWFEFYTFQWRLYIVCYTAPKGKKYKIIITTAFICLITQTVFSLKIALK